MPHPVSPMGRDLACWQHLISPTGSCLKAQQIWIVVFFSQDRTNLQPLFASARDGKVKVINPRGDQGRISLRALHIAVERWKARLHLSHYLLPRAGIISDEAAVPDRHGVECGRGETGWRRTVQRSAVRRLSALMAARDFREQSCTSCHTCSGPLPRSSCKALSCTCIHSAE